MVDITETLKVFLDGDIIKIVMSNSKSSKGDKEDILRNPNGYQSTKYIGKIGRASCRERV